jgi:ketosteroid isomerase-like protein
VDKKTIMHNPFSRLTLPILLFILALSCKAPSDNTEKWKAEIENAELSFSEMAETDGIQNAFLAFAAEDAVLKRNNKLVLGKQAIADRFENEGPNTASLTWKPEFVDVSQSGDLGYTYGYYKLVSTDSTGSVNESTGVFHTVWKRQDDGSWKFVWD